MKIFFFLLSLVTSFKSYGEIDLEDIAYELKSYHSIQWEKLFHRPQDKEKIKKFLLSIITDKDSLKNVNLSYAWKEQIKNRAIIEYGHFSTKDKWGNIDSHSRKLYEELIEKSIKEEGKISLGILESLKNTGSSYGARTLLSELQKERSESSQYEIHNWLGIVFTGEGDLEESLRRPNRFQAKLYNPNIEDPYYKRKDNEVEEAFERYLSLLEGQISKGKNGSGLRSFLKEKRQKMVALIVAKSYQESQEKTVFKAVEVPEIRKFERSNGKLTRYPASQSSISINFMSLEFWIGIFFLIAGGTTLKKWF